MKKEFVFRFVLAIGIFFLVYQFALKPLFTKDGNQSSGTNSGDIKISGNTSAEYDVIVYGEEPDGIAAAVSSARLGAKTLLLAQGKNLGGSIAKCLLTDLEVPFGKNNIVLNAGFMSELDARIGILFSPYDYLYAVNTLVKNEKSLKVMYNVSLESISIKNNKLAALDISEDGEKITVDGDIFIDSSRDGGILDKCEVAYSTGSEDLNLKNTFMPVRLNFEIQGSDVSKVKKLISGMDTDFYKVLAEFESGNVNSRISNFKIYVLDEKTVLVQGIELSNVNVLDKQKLKAAYKEAIAEAKNFATFLANRYDQLKGWKYLGAAEELYVREGKHYEGLYKLSVDDVLSNTYFDKTIAMGSYPVQIGKFAGNATLFAGKPIQYAIPIGCLIPKNFDNLLMTGAKISYSSLAASSAGTIGTSIATGNSAGITAVYCLLNNLEINDINSETDTDKIMDFNKFLAKQGMNFPHEVMDNKLKSNWVFTELQQLISLGLVSGGLDNNYNLGRKAVQSDLAMLLLNGIYRVDPSKYTLKLDAGIRPYFNNGELTRDKAARILEELYDLPDKGRNSYEKVCKLGYVDEILQLSLKNKKVLTMDDVFYLSARNIKAYTGRNIKD